MTSAVSLDAAAVRELLSRPAAMELPEAAKQRIGLRQLASFLSPNVTPAAMVDAYLLRHGDRDEATLKAWMWLQAKRFASRNSMFGSLITDEATFFAEVEPRLHEYSADIATWIGVMKSQSRWPEDRR